MSTTIQFDDGGVPGVLAALRNPRNVQRVANAMAESYVNDTLDWIAAGNAFTNRDGQLEQSIGWRPLSGGAAEVYANAAYAKYVEEGTGEFAGHEAWVIRPRDGRQALRFPILGGGGFAFARSVLHRGSQAKPFFYADSENRNQHMRQRGLSVLATILAHAS